LIAAAAGVAVACAVGGGGYAIYKITGGGSGGGGGGGGGKKGTVTVGGVGKCRTMFTAEDVPAPQCQAMGGKVGAGNTCILSMCGDGQLPGSASSGDLTAMPAGTDGSRGNFVLGSARVGMCSVAGGIGGGVGTGPGGETCELGIGPVGADGAHTLVPKDGTCPAKATRIPIKLQDATIDAGTCALIGGKFDDTDKRCEIDMCAAPLAVPTGVSFAGSTGADRCPIDFNFSCRNQAECEAVKGTYTESGGSKICAVSLCPSLHGPYVAVPAASKNSLGQFGMLTMLPMQCASMGGVPAPGADRSQPAECALGIALAGATDGIPLLPARSTACIGGGQLTRAMVGVARLGANVSSNNCAAIGGEFENVHNTCTVGACSAKPAPPASLTIGAAADCSVPMSIVGVDRTACMKLGGVPAGDASNTCALSLCSGFGDRQPGKYGAMPATSAWAIARGGLARPSSSGDCLALGGTPK